MGIGEIAFYAFSISTLIGGVFTVVSRNPVHSVLWLILSFISAAGLFVLLGAEFVAMLLIIVYVGAVAVLFLFVVMMLDVDFAELKAEMARYFPLGLLIGVIVLIQLMFAFGIWDYSDGYQQRISEVIGSGTNTAELGAIIYDEYIMEQVLVKTGNDASHKLYKNDEVKRYFYLLVLFFIYFFYE